MNNSLVSIIVPTYNVERYIEKCIESLQAQTYDNFEVLLIDDGSTDNSAQVAKNLTSLDKRFCLYTKKNGGLSDARNYGLERAKGNYVAFLDSDDYYHENFINLMIMEAQEQDADIVICDLILVDECHNVIRKQKSTLDKTIEGKRAVLNPDILNMAQNKLFKKKLFSSIKFPIGYFYEDRATTYKLFFASDKVAFVNEYLFFYLQRQNSITKVINTKKITDPLLILEEIKEYLNNKGVYEIYEKRYKIAYLLAVLSSSTQLACYSLNFYKDINNYRALINKDMLTFSNIFLLRGKFSKLCGLLLLKFSNNLFKFFALLLKDNK